MTDKPDEFSEILSSLQKYDGELWLRILGQTHWQYDELPFWVLIRDREQIADAIPVLQKLLRPLQDHSGADIAVSFITLTDDLRCSHGFFVGEDFYKDNVLEEIYDEPGCRPREMGVFDYAYPNDPWAMTVKRTE